MILARTLVLSFLSFVFISHSAFSQGEIWGTTSRGGTNNIGVIFKSSDDGTNYSVQYSLMGDSHGYQPNSGVMLAANGKLYGTTISGGNKDMGVLFEYDPVTKVYSSKFDFDILNGASPESRMFQSSDGNIYGVVAWGGETGNGSTFSGRGVIFKFDPVTGSYSKLFDFKNSNGFIPKGIAQASNGKLYGITSQGGDNSIGTLFEYDLSTQEYDEKLHFDFTTVGVATNILHTSDGKIYVSTRGSVNAGGLFEYDVVNDELILKVSFERDADMGTPSYYLVEGNGKLYGQTSSDGANGAGVIFEYDLSDETYSKKHDIAEGNYNHGTLTYGANGKLYGTGNNGSINYLFELDPNTGDYQQKLDLNALTGSVYVSPAGSLSITANGDIFGTCQEGGANGQGVIYKYNDQSGEAAIVYDFFSNANGSGPVGKLIQASNGKFYGATIIGGEFGDGVLYEFDPRSRVYQNKFNFKRATSGIYPSGTMVQTSNGKLYGTTYFGGANNNGVLFEYDPSSSTFAKKHDFDVDSGYQPNMDLLLASNGKIYGIGIQGGANGNSTVFEFDPTNGSYQKKADLTSYLNGSGGLMKYDDDKLYGMASPGNIFKYSISTGVVEDEIILDQAYGSNLNGNLVKAHNGKLYGLATAGGIYDNGTLFEFDPVTKTVSKKVDFDTDKGTYTYGDLVLSKNGKLYGTAIASGTYGNGTFFEYDTESGAFTKLLDFNGDNGANPNNKLIVTKKIQAIEFASLPQKMITDRSFELSASTNSHLPITFISSDPSIVSVTGSTATLLKTGSVTITASQPGNEEYLFATDVSQTLVINKATQTISFGTLATKTIGDASFSLSASSSSELPVRFSTSSNKTRINDAQVTLVEPGRVTITASQLGDDNYAAASPVDQSFCINPLRPAIKQEQVDGVIVLTSSTASGNQWYFNNTAIDQATGQRLSVSKAGSYTLQVKVDDCLSEVSVAQNVIITGDVGNPDLTIQVSPNPAQDWLTVSFGDVEGVKNISVYSINGVEVDSQQSNSQSLKVKVAHYANGIYFLRVITKDSSIVKRFVKN